MTHIKALVDRMDDEINDAKHYAEKYLECKAKGGTVNANRYREMALDELKHAGYVHDMAVAEIDTLNKIYKPPAAMQEAWDKAHVLYVERAAWVRQMLAM